MNYVEIDGRGIREKFEEFFNNLYDHDQLRINIAKDRGTYAVAFEAFCAGYEERIIDEKLERQGV